MRVRSERLEGRKAGHLDQVPTRAMITDQGGKAVSEEALGSPTRPCSEAYFIARSDMGLSGLVYMPRRLWISHLDG